MWPEDRMIFVISTVMMEIISGFTETLTLTLTLTPILTLVLTLSLSFSLSEAWPSHAWSERTELLKPTKPLTSKYLYRLNNSNGYFPPSPQISIYSCLAALHMRLSPKLSHELIMFSYLGNSDEEFEKGNLWPEAHGGFRHRRTSSLHKVQLIVY